MSERSDTAARLARCARCRSAHAAAARFCHRCGHDTHNRVPIASGVSTADQGRRRQHAPTHRLSQYAVRPCERVRSVHVVSTLLPLTTARGVTAYRAALAVAVTIAVAAAALGWLPSALVVAAVAVPAVITIYLYDVNEWDDQPVPVVLAAMAASVVLGAAAIGLLDVVRGGEGVAGFGRNDVDGRSVMMLGVVAPLVAVVLGLAGPLWLAARPRFDDMIDGVTFGVVSGAAYAAGETLMRYREVLTGAPTANGHAGLWMSIVANAAIVKPVLYGSALGLAAAAFSGIGAGYAGFGSRFGRALAVAAIGMVAYGVGVTLTGEIDGAGGAALGLAWGVVVASGLIVILRTRIHEGILEAALNAAHGKPSRHEARGEAYCGECDLALVPLALFCRGCGTSVRATSKRRQHFNVKRSAPPTRQARA